VARSDPAYPCPCCGYLVFEEPPGSFAICPICFWEDEDLALEFATTLQGGANRVSLARAQENFARLGACEPGMVQHVRPPGPSDGRDPAWRVIDPAVDRFERFDGPTGRQARAGGASLYYWRPGFRRRST